MEEHSVMQGLRDIYLRYLTANGSGGKGWHFSGPPWFRLRFQRLVTMKPGRRKSVERETLTRKGQRELIKGAVREEAVVEQFTLNNMK